MIKSKAGGALVVSGFTFLYLCLVSQWLGKTTPLWRKFPLRRQSLRSFFL